MLKSNVNGSVGRAWQAGLVLLSVGMVASACGSSGSSAGGSSGGSGNGYTVVFGNTLSGPKSASSDGAKAATAAFHGTNGKLVVCDNQGTTSGNLNCEEEAVRDHAAAFIEGVQDQDQSILDRNGIPVVGVATDTSPESFDVSGQLALFAGMAVALHRSGCERVGFVITEGGEQYATQIAKAESWQSVTDAFIPITAPDLSPDIAKLVNAKVQCIAFASLPTQVPQILTAVNQSGLKVPMATPGVVMTPAVLKSVGSLANGIIEITSTPDPSSAAVLSVVAKMQAVDPSIPNTAYSLSGWAVSKIIEDGAATITGKVTASSMLAALNGLRNASTDGLFPPISMIPQPVASDQRDFDNFVESYVLENGKLTQPSGFFDVTSALNASLS